MLNSKKFWIVFAVVLCAIATMAVCGSACSVNLDYILFPDTTVTYDGTEHELLISGELPEKYTVEYENNKLTEAGTVEATATIFNKRGKIKRQIFASLTVEPSASVEVPVPENVEFTYTGNEITIEVPSNELYSVKSGLSATLRGEYSLILSLNDSHNYRWTDKTAEDKTIGWEILPQKVTVPTLTGENIYNGSEQTVGIEENELYSISGNKQTIVGSYNAVLSLEDNHNYCWDDGTAEDKTIGWEILPQRVTVPAVTGEYVYNGSEQIVGIEENELYSISGNKQTNAGSYNAVLSLEDNHNYCWDDGTAEDKILPWIIQKRTYDINQYVQFNDLTTEYNGQEQFITLTGKLPEGVKAFYAGNSGTDAGVYNAYVYFEVEPNYNEIDSMLSAVLTIEKADYDMSGISFSDAVFYFERDKKQSIEITGTLPQGVTVTYINNTLSGEQNRTVTQSATAYFTGDTKNHNTIPSMTADITVTPLVFSVSFETEGGTALEALPVNRYTLLSTLNLTAIGNSMTRKGYQFVEWKNENGEEVDYSEELLDDLVLYADWDAERYSVILNTDGGTLDEGVATQYSIVYDGQFALPTPVKDKYTFIGYADKETYTHFIPEEVLSDNIWLYDLSSTEDDNELIAIWTYNLPLEETMGVSYADGRVAISVGGLGKSDDSFYNIYAVDASSYYYADSTRGLSSSVDNGTDVVAVYKSGESQRFEFDRNGSDGTDYLFKKYYIAKGDLIVKGPVYANDIEALNCAEGPDGYGSWVMKSKKGIISESASGGSVYATLDLDCSYTELNFVMNGMIVPNEIVSDDGTVVPYDGSESSNNIPYEFNGTTYYFSRSALSQYDWAIKTYSENHIKVTLIIYMLRDLNQYSVPYYLTYPGARNYSSLLTAINTSNSYGANYWSAFMSFVAERYSSGEYGYVQSYVIGNEVDYPTTWNPMIDYANSRNIPTLQEYSEEYYRTLRLADIAVKSADKDYVVLTSFTHYWTSANAVNAYTPYDISEQLIAKSMEQGNFNFGYAMHPYGANLNASDLFASCTSSDWYVTSNFRYSNQMTFLNFEQMQQYLEQDYMLYNGKTRPVYITEGGISSANNSVEEQRQQAASLAYSYYKMSMLDCVVAFIYYRMTDVPSEGACFGLQTAGGSSNKISYDMWKNIDKVSPDTYTEYITSCQYQNPRGSNNLVRFEEGDDYLSVMKKISAVCGIDYDWDTKWNAVYGTQND